MRKQILEEIKSLTKQSEELQKQLELQSLQLQFLGEQKQIDEQTLSKSLGAIELLERLDKGGVI